MGVRLLAPPLLVAVLCACRGPHSSPIPEAYAKAPSPSEQHSQGFALVELFTSEGCSSCPPAEEVLAQLGASPDTASVYLLAFHVDYWDDLGWKDAFAAPAFTARQRAYARSFGTSQMYTPQMIVNGTEAFVGSDDERARALVAQAVLLPAEAQLSLVAHRTGPGTATVDYALKSATPNARLQIAVVSGEVTVHVRSGENAGRTLSHPHVVRSLAAVALPKPTASGSYSVEVPADLSSAGAEIVAFVQSSAGIGMPILGAARIPLPR